MKRQLDKCDDILHVIGKRFIATAPPPAAVEDKFTIIAKTWAVKLKELVPLQAVYAEKLINDIFYKAHLEKLTLNSAFQTTYQPANRLQNQTYFQNIEPYRHQTQPYLQPQTLQHHTQPYNQPSHGQQWPVSIQLTYSQLQQKQAYLHMLEEVNLTSCLSHSPEQTNIKDQFQQEQQHLTKEPLLQNEPSNQKKGENSVST
ncbi:uncharacterized protein LOC126735302 isoform X1 [Anthonomus grandis grandis]|uniref:uncharacterized protein LOC126735302 isoform X1 n=1 Tax=Anthonomus grandis grandis TaxID=2921223 RepID=UPI00216570F3|nr:uncharacterized protein LOC126735302 isoform X1 [Anthonomus grandis grandis]